MTNLRVAMLLEIGTTTGAISGAHLAGIIDGRWLYVIFALVMGYSAIAMFRKRHVHESRDVPADRLADRLQLHDSYHDEALATKKLGRRTLNVDLSRNLTRDLSRVHQFFRFLAPHQGTQIADET